MNIVNNDYQINFLFKENIVHELIVENSHVFTLLVQNMWQQCNGEEGTWKLLQDEKSLNINKYIKCIINPFSISINDKTIINKLYQELKSLSDENLVLESSNINLNNINYIDKLSILTPYPLTYNLDYNITDLLKIYDVKIDTIANTLLEKIIEYLKVMNQICHINIFVFVSLKQYLNTDEISKLYEFVFYEKINILLIENHQFPILNNENIFIIDDDLCIINLDDN